MQQTTLAVDIFKCITSLHILEKWSASFSDLLIAMLLKFGNYYWLSLQPVWQDRLSGVAWDSHSKWILHQGITTLKWHTQLIAISTRGDGNEVGESFNSSSLYFQITLVKCWKMASSFWKAHACILWLFAYSKGGASWMRNEDWST